MIEVFIPNLPAHLTVEWAPTKSALFLECSRCRVTTVLYSALLMRSPEVLAEAVADHRCVTAGATPTPAP